MDILVKGKPIKCKPAVTEWQKAVGLMFKSNIQPMIFVFKKEKKHAFHTFFMLKSIDMVFVNSEKVVVDKITALPFRVHIRPKKPARYVIELPLGEGINFKLGQKIGIPV